jgi:hypothetical protein
LKADVPVIQSNAGGDEVHTVTKSITAIPYYTWANRGGNAMEVWLPTKIKSIRIN